MTKDRCQLTSKGEIENSTQSIANLTQSPVQPTIGQGSWRWLALANLELPVIRDLKIHRSCQPVGTNMGTCFPSIYIKSGQCLPIKRSIWMITLPGLVVSSGKQAIYLYLRLSVRVRILVTRTYMLWFNFILRSNFIFLCFGVW